MIQQPQNLLPQPVHTNLFMSQSSLSTGPVGGQPIAATSLTRQRVTADELATHHPIISTPAHMNTLDLSTNSSNYTVHRTTNTAPSPHHVTQASSLGSSNRYPTHAMKRVSQNFTMDNI